MAKLDNVKIQGVCLPYCKVGYFEGDKNSVKVQINYAASQQNQPLYITEAELTSEESRIIADKITALIYEQLKTMGKLQGQDV